MSRSTRQNIVTTHIKCTSRPPIKPKKAQKLKNCPVLAHCNSVFASGSCQGNILPSGTQLMGCLQCLQKVSVLSIICSFYGPLKVWTGSWRSLWRCFLFRVLSFSKMASLTTYYPSEKSRYFNQCRIISKPKELTLAWYYTQTHISKSVYGFASKY